MMIYEALSSLGVPVCHPPYKGAEETYITYQLLGQSGQLYAEGGEAETGVQYAVSIFAEGFAAGLLKRAKAALEAAGDAVHLVGVVAAEERPRAVAGAVQARVRADHEVIVERFETDAARAADRFGDRSRPMQHDRQGLDRRRSEPPRGQGRD